jgi:hypothetical protein
MNSMLPAALAAAIALASTAASADEVRAMRRGQPIVLSNPAAVADHLAAELRSCTVNTARWGRAAELWDHALASDSYLHATYSPPRKMTLIAQDNQGHRPYEVEQILLPLPENKWPSNDLARIQGEVFAYAKCDPLRLADIIREPDLGLAQVQPYKSLLDALRK